MIAYTVTCTFEDAAVADEWIEWLEREHLADVLSGGAVDAQVIRMDPQAPGPPRGGAATPRRCEVRYRFASRDAFARYERDHAPRLRAEGLRRFPPERGLRYERSVGEIAAARTGSAFQPDADAIRWRLHLDAAPETVYAMLATDAGRARFWAESAVERDGVIAFSFVNGMSCNARVVADDPPRRFALEYFGSIATFELEPDGSGGTDLTLTDRGFEPADRAELVAGWLNVLFPLKAAVEFGVDLRNHDAARTWQRGYADQ